MSAQTSIEWTDRTWNCVTGCTKVSPGCKNCYAEAVADRFWAKQYPMVEPESFHEAVEPRPRRFTDVWTHPDRLEEPLHWRKPQLVFVNSMSDLFHEDVPDEFIDQVFGVMALAAQHTFQVLTKRPERMLDYLRPSSSAVPRIVAIIAIRNPTLAITVQHGLRLNDNVKPKPRWPLPNVWLGVSVENQETADERIPLLLQTPAAIRFLSVEPMLAPVDLSPWLDCGATGHLGPCALHRPGWVIVGGESGPGARPCDVAWIRSVVAQCKAAGTACFVKQLGTRPVDGQWQSGVFAPEDYRSINAATDLKIHTPPNLILLRDRKGGTMEEWPSDLRIREFPEVGW